jgi:pancreatic triacylglycerol lipase
VARYLFIRKWVFFCFKKILSYGLISILPIFQATANTRLVGLEIAHLVKRLQEDFELRLEDVHLIGHSLGAHTAGYAGERLPGLGRITGLDPAEPYFQGMGSAIRLDKTDAQLVDVIHTDGKSLWFLEIPGYGMSQGCGHLGKPTINLMKT